ncbi:RSP_7527 family protein [Saccharospirillum impatiens]|uniref:RSP_7527 family protein n=1 Tax=Saccharospirillum impatiens TaxID=169438 RepID=UPI0003F64C5E|nr:hypothetical protein [Saccharospirillum impatiens]
MFIDPAILTNSTHHSELLEDSRRFNAYDADVAYHIRNAERLRSEAFRAAGQRVGQWVRRTSHRVFRAPSYVRHA